MSNKDFTQSLLEYAYEILRLGKEFNDINSQSLFHIGQDFITAFNTKKNLDRFEPYVGSCDNGLNLNGKLAQYIKQHPDCASELLGQYFATIDWIKKQKQIRALTLFSHILVDTIGESFDHNCKKGCSFCCHQRVGILPDEWLLITNHTDISLYDFSKQIHLSENDWVQNKYKCPFLSNNLCSIYDYRPIACRQHIVISPSEDCISGKPVLLAYSAEILILFSAMEKIFGSAHMDTFYS